MNRDVIIIGAGMVGVCTAWHLVNRGHNVILLDRKDPGQETSFGNAGIIQREAVRPYAFPRKISTLIKIIPNKRTDIRYKPTGLLKFSKELFAYWKNSKEDRYEKIVNDYAKIIEKSIDSHDEMIKSSNAHHLINKNGFLEVFRTEEIFSNECSIATKNLNLFGVEHKILDKQDVLKKEENISEEIIGGIHWTQPWIVSNPGLLVSYYANDFIKKGGVFIKSPLQHIQKNGNGWIIKTNTQKLECQDIVISLGPWSDYWLSSLGIKIPLFPKRGYHMHYKCDNGIKLNNWILDAEFGYLIAPMDMGIRLTTGAELAPIYSKPSYGQLQAAESIARDFFPLGERIDSVPWMGSRPCTPDMKPIIGPVLQHPGIWIATGHGHQGFTLGPITGRLIAQMFEGEKTDIDVTPFMINRFNK
jgi:D-amino-acid dehydrogenase